MQILRITIDIMRGVVLAILLAVLYCLVAQLDGWRVMQNT